MRKLLGWTIGLILLPSLVLVMLFYKLRGDKGGMAAMQWIAYELGLSDVKEIEK